MNLDDQLRHHDPARSVPDDLGHSPRALATLTRITAAEPGTAMAAHPTRRKRTIRYAVAASVAAAGAVLAPVLGTGNAAFADWDATPHPAPAQDAARYAQQCADWTHVSLDSHPPKVVEIRGTWAMTYLASADGEAQCLSSSEPSPDQPGGQGEAAAGPLAQTPAPDALATAGVLETSGGITHTQYMVAGKVGSKVAGVVFEAQGTQIRATVTDGTFTAWWPQRRPATLLGRLIDYTGYNGSPNPEVRITLTDGTVRTAHVKDFDVNQ